jgi:hypothetical protein
MPLAVNKQSVPRPRLRPTDRLPGPGSRVCGPAGTRESYHLVTEYNQLYLPGIICYDSSRVESFYGPIIRSAYERSKA